MCADPVWSLWKWGSARWQVARRIRWDPQGPDRPGKESGLGAVRCSPDRRRRQLRPAGGPALGDQRSVGKRHGRPCRCCLDRQSLWNRRTVTYRSRRSVAVHEVIEGLETLNEQHNVCYSAMVCSRKAIMSPMCKPGMSLFPRDKLRTSGHGMGDDERAGFESH